MSWGLITNEWRLKLLAFVLAVLMLGAVAFSQTRPTSKSLTIGLSYTVPTNLILIKPPSRTTVTVTGLSDAVSRADASNIFATVDATHATAGSSVRLNITARTTVPNVTALNPPSIVVTIDTLTQQDVKVQVVARAAPGWNIDPSKTHVTCPGAANPDPCSVRFVGPLSWETGLKAIAIVQGLVSGQGNYVNQTVQLQNQSGPIDLTVFTEPSVTYDVTSATVHMEAVQGTTSASVPLLSGHYAGPPTGYRVTAIDVNPKQVIITGDQAALARVRNITLPDLDLSGSTSDATFTFAIPYPNGISGNVANVTIVYRISRDPNVP